MYYIIGGHEEMRTDKVMPMLGLVVDPVIQGVWRKEFKSTQGVCWKPCRVFIEPMIKLKPLGGVGGGRP